MNSVVLVLQVAVAMTALYAFVHAAMQRPDAYTAADKMTKPVWLLILGASVPLTMMLSALGATIGACAAGVYLVDVRPKLLEIQGNVQAKVLYYGTAPGEIAGLMQINVKVPMMAPTGTAVALRLTVGNNISPASATVSIR